jgi:Flp pilus assembly protein TadB
VADRGLLSAALLVLSALAVAAPSTAETAAGRLIRLKRPRDGLAPGKARHTWRFSAPTGASAAAAGAAALLLGWPAGLIAGPLVFAACRTALRRLMAQGHRPEPIRIDAFAAELVATCLDAGATPAAALEAAGANLASSVGDALVRAGRALAAGATAPEALPDDGPLAPLAAVFRRSSRTGSAMSEQLIGIAAQLRADEQYERLAKAHRVGVLSALPLGLCLLPAFLLLAVVPAVIGLGNGLLP